MFQIDHYLRYTYAKTSSFKVMNVRSTFSESKHATVMTIITFLRWPTGFFPVTSLNLYLWLESWVLGGTSMLFVNFHVTTWWAAFLHLCQNREILPHQVGMYMKQTCFFGWETTHPKFFSMLHLKTMETFPSLVLQPNFQGLAPMVRWSNSL